MDLASGSKKGLPNPAEIMYFDNSMSLSWVGFAGNQGHAVEMFGNPETISVLKVYSANPKPGIDIIIATLDHDDLPNLITVSATTGVHDSGYKSWIGQMFDELEISISEDITPQEDKFRSYIMWDGISRFAAPDNELSRYLAGTNLSGSMVERARSLYYLGMGMGDIFTQDIGVLNEIACNFLERSLAWSRGEKSEPDYSDFIDVPNGKDIFAKNYLMGRVEMQMYGSYLDVMLETLGFRSMITSIEGRHINSVNETYSKIVGSFVLGLGFSMDSFKKNIARIDSYSRAYLN